MPALPTPVSRYAAKPQLFLGVIMAVAVAAVVCGTALPLSGWAATKTLPAAYQKSGKPTIVAFFANWCSACKQIRPLERELERRTEANVTWHHANIDEQAGRILGYRYKVHSTPSYVFFNEKGDPTFMLTGNVSPAMLKLQSFKLAGLRNAIEFPSTEGKTIRNTEGAMAHLIRFTANGCKTDPCKSDSLKFAYFQQQLGLWPYSTGIWQLDADTDKPYLSQLSQHADAYEPRAGVYYALVDNDGVPLFRYNRPLTTDTMQTIARILQMVAAGQPR